MPRKATATKSTKNVDKNISESSPNKDSKSAKKSKSVKVESKAKTAKEPTSSKTSKSVKKSKSVKVVESPAVDIPDVQDETTKKKRQIPTKESVIVGYDEIVSVIDGEIARLRESTGKAKGVKFLRSLGKRVKTLRGHSVRVMKQKQKTNRKNNNNSGFLKPVQISSDMAKFTGWNEDELRSRVDVTKYICQYIRDNNLQNPDDRRQIVADKKLSKLLEYSADNDEKPLTYYRIQTYMKKHFSNPPKTE